MDDIGKNVPKLGFGLMRLPMVGEEVDIQQTEKMVDRFLDHGYTYFDTAWGYLAGKSEEAAKATLTSRHPRESYLFATKLPAWVAKNEQDAKKLLETSLKRTGLDYFDFYLLHNLGGERTATFDKYGIWDYLAEKKKEGVIKKLGFSIHATPEHLDEMLALHPEMDFVQLQINYADWEDPLIQSRRSYEVARKHGKPIVIMEPVKGGTLTMLPAKVEAALREANPGASLASWALRYAASLDGLITVLSGMSTLEQMEENLQTMDHFEPFNERERAAIAEAQKMFASVPNIPCTDCRYCTSGCPSHIDIPDVFKAMNLKRVFDNDTAAKGGYDWALMNGQKASDCIACGKCERVCPQSIPIIEELAAAVRMFEM